MMVLAHLLNDYSGSPRILGRVINALQPTNATGESLRLYVGRSGEGCLSHVDVPVVHYWYRRSSSRLVTLFNYTISQFVLLGRLLADRRIARNAVVYVNTLMPFGAALFGRLTKRKVVYHLQEISLTPAALRWFLVCMARMTSSLNIYVSRSHRDALPVRNVPSRVLYNSLDEESARRGANSIYVPRRAGVFNILMLASLRDYKGIPELVTLCESLLGRADVQFQLVANDDARGIDQYFRALRRPANLTVHERVDDPSPFYENASLVLNLSRPDLWVETFGLTVLEALTFGIPVIAPPVGGPSELITHHVQGFLVDSRDQGALRNAVCCLLDDGALCMEMSAAGRRRAADFSMDVFRAEIRQIIDDVIKS